MPRVHSYNLGLRQRIKGLLGGEGEMSLKLDTPYSMMSLISDYGYRYG